MKIIMIIYKENEVLGSINLSNSGLGYRLMFSPNGGQSFFEDIPLFDKYVMGGIPDCYNEIVKQDYIINAFNNYDYANNKIAKQEAIDELICYFRQIIADERMKVRDECYTWADDAYKQAGKEHQELIEFLQKEQNELVEKLKIAKKQAVSDIRDKIINWEKKLGGLKTKDGGYVNLTYLLGKFKKYD